MALYKNRHVTSHFSFLLTFRKITLIHKHCQMGVCYCLYSNALWVTVKTSTFQDFTMVPVQPHNVH